MSVGGITERNARTRNLCFGTISANNILCYLHFRKCQYTLSIVI